MRRRASERPPGPLLRCSQFCAGTLRCDADVPRRGRASGAIPVWCTHRPGPDAFRRGPAGHRTRFRRKRWPAFCHQRRSGLMSWRTISILPIAASKRCPHPRQTLLASAGLPASTTTSRIKPLWPATKLSLCPYCASRARHIEQAPQQPRWGALGRKPSRLITLAGTTEVARELLSSDHAQPPHEIPDSPRRACAYREGCYMVAEHQTTVAMLA